jgi:hypothetical protein
MGKYRGKRFALSLQVSLIRHRPHVTDVLIISLGEAQTQAEQDNGRKWRMKKVNIIKIKISRDKPSSWWPQRI